MIDKVSVIIPLFNKEDYIFKTLISVLNQTYSNLEIIIIDDGSTDRSYEMIRAFISNLNNIVYRKIKNSGVSNARNLGLQISTGKYITFLDADDILLENKISNDISTLIGTSYDAVYSGTISKYSNGRKQKERIIFKKGKIFNFFVKGYLWPQTGTWLIKREFIIRNKLHFNSTISWGEDFDFFSRIMIIGNVTFSRSFNFIYNRVPNSLSKFDVKMVNEIYLWNNLNEIYTFYTTNNYKKYTENEFITKFRIPSVFILNLYRSYKNNKISDFKLEVSNFKFQINKFKFLKGYLPYSFRILLIHYFLRFKLGKMYLNILSRAGLKNG
jgi:glycosyltransferase involved in cell wall biosynthesis